MQERGRNSAATRSAITSMFAARIEMPVVLRGGTLNDEPALVPAALAIPAGARVSRRFGTIGWITATAACALSVYAVRDTMFAPLAQSDAPSSAWETRTHPGDTTSTLVATHSSSHIDLDDHDASPTGTSVADVDPGGPSVTGSGAHAGDDTGTAQSTPTSATTPGGGDAPGTTAGPTTSSTATTSTPDTLGGHGANSGRGGHGDSGSP